MKQSGYNECPTERMPCDVPVVNLPVYSRSSEPVRFERDCDAVLVPQGEAVTLPAGSVGYITQALGGSWTVFVEGNLMRIAGKDADAIGKEPPTPIELPEGASDDEVEKLVWSQLRTCFDPEIPINVVDLGLVYEATVARDGRDPGRRCAQQAGDDPHRGRGRCRTCLRSAVEPQYDVRGRQTRNRHVLIRRLRTIASGPHVKFPWIATRRIRVRQRTNVLPERIHNRPAFWCRRLSSAAAFLATRSLSSQRLTSCVPDD